MYFYIIFIYITTVEGSDVVDSQVMSLVLSGSTRHDAAQGRDWIRAILFNFC